MAGPAENRPRETLFLLVCHDAPGADVLRETHLRAHLGFIERHVARILVAGPVLDDAGAIEASIFVLRAGDEDDARALLARDPYFQNGVWAQVDARRFRGVCGTGIGGVTWDSVL